MAHGHKQFTDEAGIIEDPNPLDPRVLDRDPEPLDPFAPGSLPLTQLKDVTAGIDTDLLDRGTAIESGTANIPDTPEDITAQEEAIQADKREAAANKFNDPEDLKVFKSETNKVFKDADVSQTAGLAEMFGRLITGNRGGVFDGQSRERMRLFDLGARNALGIIENRKASRQTPSPQIAADLNPGLLDVFSSSAFEPIQNLGEEFLAGGDPTSILRQEGHLTAPENIAAFNKAEKVRMAREIAAPTQAETGASAQALRVARTEANIAERTEDDEVKLVKEAAIQAGLETDDKRLRDPLERTKITAETDLANNRSKELKGKLKLAMVGVSPAIDKEFDRLFKRVTVAAGVTPFIDPITGEVNATALFSKSVDQENLQAALLKHSQSKVLVPNQRNRERFGEWLDYVKSGVAVDKARRAEIEGTLIALERDYPAALNAGEKKKRYSEELDKWFISDGEDWTMQ